MMNYDPYYLKAKLFPTILTAIPALAFYNYIISPLFSETLKGIWEYLPSITNISFSSAIIFFLVEINRFIGKEVFQKKYFDDDIRMPTTNVLLWTDSYYEFETKNLIRQKIKQNFNLILLSASDEAENETKARKLATFAISQIRNSLRNNKLLLQHNIYYGFFRNLFGGCLVALFFSLLLLISSFIFNYQSLKVTSGIFVFLYAIIPTFSKLIMKQYGLYYCKILFQEFLSTK